MRHAIFQDQVLIFAAIQGPSLREAAFEHHCTPWGNDAGAEKEGSRSDRMKVVVLAWVPERNSFDHQSSDAHSDVHVARRTVSGLSDCYGTNIRSRVTCIYI